MFLDVTPAGELLGPVKLGKGDLDKSHKFFLISAFLQKNISHKASDYCSISEGIENNNKVYISPDECKEILNQYRFVISRPNNWSILLTLITCVCMLYVSWGNVAINLMAVMFFFPYIFNSYNNFLIAMKLFSFDLGQLTPPVSDTLKKHSSVSIVIASRNEPFPVAKMTFDSALSLHYPSDKKQIIVVDNSDEMHPDYQKWKVYVESYKQLGVDVEFIHRSGVEGFKPKNLDIALKHVAGDYVLYMDIDSTLAKDTLLRVMPLFGYDDELAFIQLQAIPTNARATSSLALAQSIQNYFLRFGAIFLSNSSHTLFYGHNAIWKTKAVQEMGNCLEYYNGEVIVTEDLSMSLRALFNGYYGAGAWVESGEWVPESLRETESMWLRWTVGTYQVYAKHANGIFRLLRKKPRDFAGWMQHVISLTNNALTPVYVLVGLLLNSNIFMFMVLLSLLPEVAQAIYASTKFSLGKASLIKRISNSYKGTLILSSYLNWIKLIGLFRFLTKQEQGWRPTGKAPEQTITTTQVIKIHFIYLICGVFFTAYSIYSMALVPVDNMSFWLFLICGIYGLHSILSICLFGKSKMSDSIGEAVENGHIDEYLGFYCGAHNRAHSRY